MTDPVDIIVRHLERDTWDGDTRREFLAKHGKMVLDDAERRARNFVGKVEPPTKAEWLAKVEALRIECMKALPADIKVAHATAAKCLDMQGKALGFIGADSGKGKAPEAKPDQDERAVWLDALRNHCPPDVLADFIEEQRGARH